MCYKLYDLAKNADLAETFVNELASYKELWSLQVGVAFCLGHCKHEHQPVRFTALKAAEKAVVIKAGKPCTTKLMLTLAVLSVAGRCDS